MPEHPQSRPVSSSADSGWPADFTAHRAGADDQHRHGPPHYDDTWTLDPVTYAAGLELEWSASRRSLCRDMGRLVHPLARRPERSRS
ncbi:hypothetical protein SUDANB15_07181 [Streptomyces sp. enrichment culture]